MDDQPDGPDPDGPDPGGPDPDASRAVGYALVITAVVAVVAFTVWLLRLDDRGDRLASILGFGLAALTAVILLANKYLPLPTLSPPLRQVVRYVLWLVSAACLVFAVVLVVVAFRTADLPLTDVMQASSSKDFAANGDTLKFSIPAPNRRNTLSISFAMDSRDPTRGNCAGSAYLAVGLSQGGAPTTQQHSDIYPDTEVRLSLADAPDTAAVVAVLSIPRDQECRVRVGVREAVLFNS